MEFKTDGIITVDKVKKKKVKCYKFHCKPLNRYLMLHSDPDSINYTTLSDFSTGYRLFKLPINYDKIHPDIVTEKLKSYISHFTIEGIQEEIQRLQSVEEALRKK